MHAHTPLLFAGYNASKDDGGGGERREILDPHHKKAGPSVRWKRSATETIQRSVFQSRKPLRIVQWAALMLVQ